jgi:hypothetical protein
LISADRGTGFRHAKDSCSVEIVLQMAEAFGIRFKMRAIYAEPFIGWGSIMDTTQSVLPWHGVPDFHAASVIPVYADTSGSQACRA